MKKKKISLKGLLIVTAVLSFVITALESYIYYESRDNVFRVLLTLQNIINTFKFSPLISLEANAAFIKNSTDSFTVFIGYAYAVSVFTAPFCTLAVIYKALEKVLSAFLDLKSAKNGEDVVIFGWNSDVKALVGTNENYTVHIITKEEFTAEEKYSLIKSGCRIHNIDMFTATKQAQEAVLKKARAFSAPRVLLFHESAVGNLSLLQMFLEKKPPENAKIICRCSNDAVREIITELYNKELGSSGHKLYDLEIVSLAELRVRKLYETVPLYSYYKDKDTKLKNYDVRLLIAGFGELGRQAAVQAMNLGVMHKENKVIIDVYDTDIDSKKERFLNRLDGNSFIKEKDSVHYDPSIADGELTINFRRSDITYSSFTDAVREKHYTYAIIAVEDENAALECMVRALGHGASFPVFLRMDNDRRLANYLESSTNVHIINTNESVLTLEMIFSDSIDRTSKRFNFIYNAISFGGEDTKFSEYSDTQAEAMWNALELFKRDSCKATAYHQRTNEMILGKLAEEYGIGSAEDAADMLIGENGVLLRSKGFSLSLNGTDEDFVKTAYKTPIAYDFLAMEHRRWCYFMASMGWGYGEKKDVLNKKNPCFMTQDDLSAKKPDMVKYDIMPIAAMRDQQKSE